MGRQIGVFRFDRLFRHRGFGVCSTCPEAVEKSSGGTNKRKRIWRKTQKVSRKLDFAQKSVVGGVGMVTGGSQMGRGTADKAVTSIGPRGNTTRSSRG